jgi:hypothetical protein
MNQMEDLSVSVTRAFRPDGTTYPVYWEVRNSAMGEQLMAGIREERDPGYRFMLVDEPDTEITKQHVMDRIREQGHTTSNAARITWWLYENGLIAS